MKTLITVKPEFVEGLGNAYGFDMARKEALCTYLTRVLYCMFYHEKPFQAQLGAMAFLELTSKILSDDGHEAKWVN